MSISSVCIEQREKEQEALKTFLACSIVGSAAFHLVLAFGLDLVWPKGSSLASEPIEFIVVDPPKAEIKQPEEKIPPKPPSPEPLAKPTPVATPEAIKPPKPDLVTPPPPAIPQQSVEKPPEVVKPIAPPPEPPAPQPEVVPIPTEPKKVITTPVEEPRTSPAPLPPPKVTREFKPQITEPTPTQPTPEETPTQPKSVAANTLPPQQPTAISQPLQTRSQSSRSFRNNIPESTPAKTIESDPSETNPETPGTVTNNQPPPPTRSTANNQPLQASNTGNRAFRDNFSANNSPVASNLTDDPIQSAPGVSGGVAVNREAPPRPTVNSQPIQGSGTGNRGFRDNLSSNNSPVASNPTDEVTPFNPEVSAGVAVNREAPPRPTVNSQPLQGSVTGNRGFRENFGSSNSSGIDSTPTDDPLASNLGGSSGVAVNREAPPRPAVNSQPIQGSGTGNRGFRENFGSSNSSGIDSTPTDDPLASNLGGSAGVTVNREAPPRPTVNSQPLQGSGTGNRGFRENFASSNSSAIGSGTNSDTSPAGLGTSTGVVANRIPTPGSRRSRGGSGGIRCISGCNPQFPASLADLDVEGRPVIQFVVETDGRTSEAQLIQSSGNSELDRIAVEAVTNMKFASPQGGRAPVELAINFANSGSDFERQARQRREANERQRRERERQQQRER
ncbi:energy transducer TonB [Argonema antarcticum]|uniref:energy transducer TonB n=1 Tax=Argonema antarcticum TaxID=2942763 RepID=UPI0020116FA8|nr:energy transducer TonB [Argonema antarcticum]MCL1472555.1 TonB family protein [Argonema antarcticum A004/B2]